MQTGLPDHVVMFTAPQRMSRADIRSFVRRIEEKLAVHDRIGVVADVTRLRSMTPGAIVEDVKAEARYLGQWGRFSNLALVAADGFLKSLADTISGIVPGMDLRVFDPRQMDEAIEFASRAGGQERVTADHTL